MRKKPSSSNSPPSIDEQKEIILGILVSFLEVEDWISLGDFIRHIALDFSSFTDPKNFVSVWLGHYRVRQGQYDVDRAYNDMATFPPIVARIAELRAERDGV